LGFVLAYGCTGLDSEPGQILGTTMFICFVGECVLLDILIICLIPSLLFVHCMN